VSLPSGDEHPGEFATNHSSFRSLFHQSRSSAVLPKRRSVLNQRSPQGQSCSLQQHMVLFDFAHQFRQPKRLNGLILSMTWVCSPQVSYYVNSFLVFSCVICLQWKL
jgi:hypothetical protein